MYGICVLHLSLMEKGLFITIPDICRFFTWLQFEAIFLSPVVDKAQMQVWHFSSCMSPAAFVAEKPSYFQL